MTEKEHGSHEEWGLDICPLRNKQCLRQQCAWWLKEAKICAITKIASQPKG